MSDTMARQCGWVQQEQSNMLLAWNMAEMAKGGFLHTAMEKTQPLINQPSAIVGEVKM